MEELQAQVDRLTKLVILGSAPEHELSMVKRREIIEATTGTQGTTIEEFRANGNQLQSEMQTQINQMQTQNEEFRASGNTLQAEIQATVNQMRAQLLDATSSIDLLKTNMAHVHGKIDMGLIS